MSAPETSAPKVVDAALKGLCPRCGSKTLFDGFLRFAPRCRMCRLDFDQFNVGDGPAAFLTLGVGTIVTILAIVVELAYQPPALVHLLLWLPLTVALVLSSLRVAKAALLALEYRNKAREGRLQ